MPQCGVTQIARHNNLEVVQKNLNSLSAILPKWHGCTISSYVVLKATLQAYKLAISEYE